MIKQVIFSKTNSLDDGKQIVLDFSKNINVIIGPKGGGKSTLFDLLAGLKENYIPENVKGALQQHGLRFYKAINFNNEEILSGNLSTRKTNSKEENYINRNDVISQDDPIKKNFTDGTKIKENKIKYLNERIFESKEVSDFVSEIREFYNLMKYFYELTSSSTPNWSSAFKINELQPNFIFKLITELNYKTIDVNNLIQNENYNSIVEKSARFLHNIRDLKNLVTQKTVYKDEKFTLNISHQINVITDEITKLLNLITKRTKMLKKIEKIISSFKYSYDLILKKIDNQTFSSNWLTMYRTSAKKYFSNFAQTIKKINSLYLKIFQEETYLNISDNKTQTGKFKYQIKNPVHISDELKNEILGKLFYKKDSIQKDIGKWLKSLNKKGIKKTFDDVEIKYFISEKIPEQVKVLVCFNNEWKDYDTLSLGQKSIYGLIYKFDNSLHDDLFLDQPEDNLDNNTITNEILPLFEKKKDNQVFIVTHNANIGILSNPSQVIVANLNDVNEPYKVSGVLEEINKKSASYLEGGEKYLEKRYNKIIKNIKEN